MLLVPALLLAASVPSAAQAEPSRPTLAASSKWAVEYADNSCNIGKTFSASGKEVKLWMRLLPGRANTQILIEEKRDAPLSFRDGDLVITPTPGHSFVVGARSGSVKAGSYLVLATTSADGIAAMENAETLTFAYRGKTFKLTRVNLKAALAAARTCEDDLLTSWGLDPVAYRKITTPPQPSENPANWISDSDYPATTLKAGRGGRVLVRLDIATTGQVERCAIIASSLVSELDETTCAKLMKHARFTPARTADGSAAPSMAFLTYRWQIWDTSGL